MTTTIQRPKRPPVWRDITVLKWTAQIVFLFLVVGLFWVLGTEAVDNLRAQNIPLSTDFLSRPVGITLGEGFNTTPGSGIEAIAVGIVNMLRVTISGIIAATILGIIVGVSRLSSNWLVNKVATGYIEIIRNIPLLVQIVFWLVVVQTFEELTVEDRGEGLFYASPKGFAFAWFRPTETRWQWVAFVAIGLAVAWFVYRWRIKIQESGAHDAHAFAWSGGVLLAFAVVGLFAHPLMGVFGWIFGAIAWVFGNVPLFVFQLLLAGLALYIGWRVISTRLDELRTPAGLGKLSDDDWYRLIMAGVLGLAGAIFFLVSDGVVGNIMGRTPLFGARVGLEPLFSSFADRFSFSGGWPFDFSPALVAGDRFVNFDLAAGKVMTPAFFALWTGVTLYTAAFIGEAVRAGIMAVPRGQTEAGLAVGLKRGQLLRMIVLPQAFRIILPPIGNQYLNLAKNTSLGIAVAYSELVQVGQTIFNQTGQTIPVFIIWMLWFSFVSLSLSAVVNAWNRRLKLVER